MRTSGETMILTRGETTRDDMIRRFTTPRIIEHWLAVTTIVVLVVTGLSQKFYYLEFSQWFILRLGIDNVRLVHRYTGIVFTIAMLLHITAAIVGVLFRKWQPSMLISRKDFSDAIHNIKYYVGMESQPALCDRYNYKQKFEYWSILIGGLLMSVSGLVIWFPIRVTRFLPGEIIPAAKVLHTNEALLIFLIIAVWHIYNSIFNPEVFPLDTSMFTGYISRERMEKEHPLELARLEGKPVEEIIARGFNDPP